MKLAVEGSNVIINYSRRRSAAELTAQEAHDRGATAHIVTANVREFEKIDSTFDGIEAGFGRMDIPINNAAIGVARSAVDSDSQG